MKLTTKNKQSAAFFVYIPVLIVLGNM